MYFLGFAQELSNVWKVDVDPRTLKKSRAGRTDSTTTIEQSTSMTLSRDGARIAVDVANWNSRIRTYELDGSGRSIIGAESGTHSC